VRYEPDPDRPAVGRPPTAQARRPHVATVNHPVDAADLRPGIARVLRVALEVLDGRRPLAQLAPHLAPSAVRYVRAATAQRPPLREPARLTSLHVCRPGDGTAEVAAVYRRGPRARALAARFECTRSGRTPAPASRTGRPEWQCVTLRLL
jgi:hypothetical protein